MVIKYVVGKIINPFICTPLMLGSRSKYKGGMQNGISWKDI